jgi:hypothetical protein
MVATFVAIVAGAIRNGLSELAPSLAHLLLRLAARMEASTSEEKGLLYGEMSAMLEEVPTKLTQLLFAVGRATYALRHVEWKSRRKRVEKKNQEQAFFAKSEPHFSRFWPLYSLVSLAIGIGFSLVLI